MSKGRGGGRLGDRVRGICAYLKRCKEQLSYILGTEGNNRIIDHLKILCKICFVLFLALISAHLHLKNFS